MSNILDELDAAEKAGSNPPWIPKYMQSLPLTFNAEFICLMRNNISALIDVAKIAKGIFPMGKPQGEYVTFQVQMHASLVEKMQNALKKLRGDDA